MQFSLCTSFCDKTYNSSKKYSVAIVCTVHNVFYLCTNLETISVISKLHKNNLCISVTLNADSAIETSGTSLQKSCSSNPTIHPIACHHRKTANRIVISLRTLLALLYYLAKKFLDCIILHIASRKIAW